MATVNCDVTAAGGGWTPTGDTYPTNQNDGDAGSYQATPGDGTGSNNNYYDYTDIPDGAVISDVEVSGLWGAGSAAATCTVRCYLGASNTLLDSALNDVSSYSYSIARPGGGTWTKADVQTMYVNWTSNATGNGSNIRLKSSVLTVTYILSGFYVVSIY